MRTRIQIKHLFDLDLNKPLAKDILDLLIAEGRASSLLARSLSAYLNNSDMIPLTTMSYLGLVTYIFQIAMLVIST